ncbi:MAG TPA: hypothetical protein VMM76_26855 [Pirellulaceae bacterium]|nr:hypothetical protein [Pirellulaceae bacterium]
MSDFDPYHKWLGISPRHQPPNHYRLLSLDLYEPDSDVIEAAADRIVIFLQDVAAGPQAKESQKLLNEIAAARLCLLDETRKACYDDRLRAELAQAIWPPEDDREPAPPPVAPAFAINTSASSTAKQPVIRKSMAKRPAIASESKRKAALPANKKPKQRQQRASPLLPLSFVSGGVLLIGAIAFALLGGDSEAKRRAAEEARIRERQESFAELGREAESMIPDFEANFNSNAAVPAKNSNKNQKRSYR